MCAAAAAELGDRFVLPALVFRVARALRTAVDRQMAPLGVTTQQAALLHAIDAVGGHRFTRLAGPLGTDPAGLTRLVDRLESKRLLVRESAPDDRRAVVLRLTPDGEAIVPQLREAFARAHDELLGDIPSGERERLEAVLREVLASVRRRSCAAEPA